MMNELSLVKDEFNKLKKLSSEKSINDIGIQTESISLPSTDIDTSSIQSGSTTNTKTLSSQTKYYASTKNSDMMMINSKDHYNTSSESQVISF